MKRGVIVAAIVCAPATAFAQQQEPQPYPYTQPQPYAQPQPYPYAQPQPYPQPQPPVQEAPQPVKERATHSIKLEAGGGYRKLDDVGFVGMDYRGSFGSEGEDLAHYGTIGFIWGATNEKLRTYGVTAGYALDGKIDIVRLGFGLEAGFLWVRRATLDAHLWALGAGAFAHASVDVVKLGRGGRDALFVDARLEGMAYLSDVFFWGPSLMLGFRF